jgi:glutamate synthase (NADPH/NADH) large chain
MMMNSDEERDACGIVAVIQRSPLATTATVELALQALARMAHRAGFVAGEGDGCGLLMDVPRAVWASLVGQSCAQDERFAVGHLLLADESRVDKEVARAQIATLCTEMGFTVLEILFGRVHPEALGPGARSEDTGFVQLALFAPGSDLAARERACFDLTLRLEAQLPVHVASLSTETVVYKVRGDSRALTHYYEDFSHPGFTSRVVIGHNRYSTNTATRAMRAQPCHTLAHNGELNTIARLRAEGEWIGVELPSGGSDSQDLDRVVETLRHRYGFSLWEAMELVFPPIINDIKHMRGELQDLYMYMRRLWGPFAQGPAAIVARAGAEAVCAVDALGLRPLWLLETRSQIIVSSEAGVVPISTLVTQPHPLAPGEKLLVEMSPTAEAIVHDADAAREITLARMSKRYALAHSRRIVLAGPVVLAPLRLTPVSHDERGRDLHMAAFGWEQDDVRMLEAQAASGVEMIRSLGFDGPLAALTPTGANVADFLKETVAVVTNPAIDREREIEHFSTRTVLGERPDLSERVHSGPWLELQTPLLVGGHTVDEPDRYRALAQKLGTQVFEDVAMRMARTPADTVTVYPRLLPDETMQESLARLEAEVSEAVAQGAVLVLVDDRLALHDGACPVDPALVVATVDGALRSSRSPSGACARRRCSIAVRSGAVRNLHDVMVLIGLGADAICPYLYLEAAWAQGGWKGIENACDALHKGIEKVISTLGIHELRGYDRLFSAVGLASDVALRLGVESHYAAGQEVGTLAAFEALTRGRVGALAGGQGKPARGYQLWPRIWKAAHDAATGHTDHRAFTDKLRALEQAQPISLRHLLDVSGARKTVVDPRTVDLTVGEHALPFVISSMSFGSQGEAAFRAYAQAAQELNMVSLNGEGGEIPDMLGQYARHRGHQIASGRFGVNAALCNSADLLEIKIGQGAKPGEGGHLPGSKVSAQVARARNAQAGTDLISPSNNHDIYSIEDLAQMIAELKAVNKSARVAVKVPVVPGIGTIAVGIAKAGADIITLSGYDGGTGAARAHALRHVGLPVEIGVRRAHVSLCEAGLRSHVELWCDGGMKSGLDAAKMMLLGANRVGFGTMAMVAIGCTGCRACHTDTCHVGIATQIASVDEAVARGLRAFTAVDPVAAVEQLHRFFTAVAGELRDVLASFGATSAQAIVGHAHLLHQERGLARLDLSELLAPVQVRALGLASSVAVDSGERLIGAAVAGATARAQVRQEAPSARPQETVFTGIAGAGFGIYNVTGTRLQARGGAQDAVGKGASGGRVIVLRARNESGEWLGGCVGKGLAYGAQAGLFIVQGDADARAGIRLSGADVIIGGELREPVRADAGVGARANIKGFAFEYMTAGRAVVLGDPGPWICSGMTGGAVYLRVVPEMGLTVDVLRTRLAKGAKVALMPLQPQDVDDLQSLLALYEKELSASGQFQAAAAVTSLRAAAAVHFVVVRPRSEQTDQDVATE